MNQLNCINNTYSESKKKKDNAKYEVYDDFILNIATLAVSIVGAALLFTVFSACGSKDDGTYMSCHTTQMIEIAIALIVGAIAICRGFFSHIGQIAPSIVNVLVSLYGLIGTFPGTYTHFCMMEDMMCHTRMRPAALVIMSILFGMSVAALIRSSKHILNDID